MMNVEPMVICTHSLGIIAAPPLGITDVNGFLDSNSETLCTICRMPLNEHQASILTLEPCKHMFHKACYLQAKQMHRQHNGYASNGQQRRAHCPLCRTPTTTNVSQSRQSHTGVHRKALADPTTAIAYRLPIPEGSDSSVKNLSDTKWCGMQTGMLPVTAHELVPLTKTDARWSEMVAYETPLYVPSHGIHGKFKHTTRQQVCMIVYPDGHARRFAKHNVAAFAASWKGVLSSSTSTATAAASSEEAVDTMPSSDVNV